MHLELVNHSRPASPQVVVLKTNTSVTKVQFSDGPKLGERCDGINCISFANVAQITIKVLKVLKVAFRQDVACF